MRRLRWFALLMTLAAFATLLAACGGDDGDETDPTPSETPAASATLAPEPTELPAPTEPPAPEPTDPPEPEPGNGGAPPQIGVTAQNLTFSPNVIFVPAAAPFNLVLENGDSGVSHNIAIFADQAAAQAGNAIIASPIEAGPSTQTLSVSSLAAGDYFAWCQIHTVSMAATVRAE